MQPALHFTLFAAAILGSLSLGLFLAWLFLRALFGALPPHTVFQGDRSLDNAHLRRLGGAGESRSPGALQTTNR